MSTPYTIEVDDDDQYYDDVSMMSVDVSQQQPQQQQKLHPDDQYTSQLKSSVTRRRGRGFSSAVNDQSVINSAQQGFEGISHFEHLDFAPPEVGFAQKSVEGWNVFITGLHPETPEDDLRDLLADEGKVRQLRMNLDHQTGYVKGYAIAEFESSKGAARAIEAIDGTMFMGHQVRMDWAFVLPPRDMAYEEMEGLRSVPSYPPARLSRGGRGRRFFGAGPGRAANTEQRV